MASGNSPRYALQVVVGPDKGRAFGLAKEQVTIGRAEDNDIVLADAAVSQHHVAIVVSEFGCTLKDAGSRHGTGLNGKKIAGDEPLKEGDEIIVGNTKLKFRDLSAQKEAAAAPAQQLQAAAPAAPTPIGAESDIMAQVAEIDASAMDYMEGSKKPILPFVLPGAVILIMLALGTWGVRKIVSTKGVRAGNRNYLAPNASFEQEVGGDGLPLGWKREGDAYQWALQTVEDSKVAVAKSPAQATPLSRSALVRNRVIDVGTNVGFVVSGWTKATGGQGVAAVRVRWLGEPGSDFGTDQYVGVVAGTSEWTPFTQALAIPIGAKRIEVACEAFGKVGEAGFDELVLNDENALEKAPHKYVVEFPESIALNPTDQGVMNVRFNGALALADGEATLTPDGLASFGRHGLSQPTPNYPQIDDETNSIVFRGVMFMPSDSAPRPVDYVQRITPTEGGIDVEFTFRSKARITGVVPGVSFAMSPALAAGSPVALVKGAYAAQQAGFEKTDAEEIMWGQGESALVVAYNKPGTLKHTTVAGKPVLAYFAKPTTIEPDGSVELKLTLTNISPKRGRVFDKAVAKVKELAGDGKWGDALKAAKAIAGVPVFSAEQREELQKEVDAIVAKVDERLSQLETQLGDADKAQSTQDLMKVEQDIDALAAILKGSDQEAKVKALLAKLEETRARHKAELEAIAQSYMDRAQQCRKKKQFLLARIYIENVLRQFPRTDVAKKAAEQLAIVKKEVAKADEKLAWMQAKLTEGDNFIKNKLPEKGKAAYQEIIDKYPDSPQAAQAKKRLAGLAARTVQE